MIHFDWDPPKSAKNRRERGFGFEAASLVFEDPYAMTEEDSVDEGEQRLRTIGMVNGEAILLVIHLQDIWEFDVYVRIISARKATPTERSDYEQNRAANGGPAIES
jgi:uncharacterized DUF497 family protein